LRLGWRSNRSHAITARRARREVLVEDGSFLIGLIQMRCRLEDKAWNLAHAQEELRSLPEGVAIACLPEFFNTGYHLDLIGDAFYELAEPIPGPTTALLGRLARERQMVILGNIPEADTLQEGVLYDTTFVLDRRGQLMGRYRKTHLYPTEHRYFRAGGELPVFDVELARIGVAICFDHAFPEVFTTLAVQGAQVVFIPSAVPVGYEYLLDLRTRARAQDNQLWTAAVNRVGQEGEVAYCGLSKVVNPRGEVVAEASAEGEERLIAEVDLSAILRERRQEPMLRARRPALYR
jgi:predicted amidohydrolase